MENMSKMPDSESVTLLIQQKVRKDSIDRYEKWLAVIMARAATYKGHQGVHVVRPHAGGNDYAVIIRFASLALAEAWVTSDTRKKLVAEIEDVLEAPDQTEIHPGIDFWFTPPTLDNPRPKAWKQWLVTTSVIWPLTMLVPALYKPLFVAVPLLGMWGISHGIVASTIVALVVFVIMPRYVRAVYGWLHR